MHPRPSLGPNRIHPGGRPILQPRLPPHRKPKILAQCIDLIVVLAEWDRATARDAGVPLYDAATATGDDPAHLPSDDEDVPRSDLPPEGAQPETQGLAPELADQGDTGHGDLAPEDY